MDEDCAQFHCESIEATAAFHLTREILIFISININSLNQVDNAQSILFYVVRAKDLVCMGILVQIGRFHL